MLIVLKAIENVVYKEPFYHSSTCHYCFSVGSIYWGLCYSELCYSEGPLYLLMSHIPP